MGDKEFHEMLGILCDYDDLINEVSSTQNQDDRRAGLLKLASQQGITLDERDITDLLKGLDGIINMKNRSGSCFYASPRN